jgi:opacity protein-like surface antigen
MARRAIITAVLAAGLVAPAAVASAQSFGIGPRLSFVRGDLATATPAQRLIGGTIRLVMSPHTALEGAIDYRSELSEDGTTRARDTPITGSLWLFPVRSVVSPYFGGGIGLYTHSVDAIGPAGQVTATAVDKKVGWHLGGGLEIRLARHAAIYADYRYRFVKFGGDTTDPTDEAATIPLISSIPGFDKLHFTHQGSMWTSGMAFYF